MLHEELQPLRTVPRPVGKILGGDVSEVAAGHCQAAVAKLGLQLRQRRTLAYVFNRMGVSEAVRVNPLANARFAPEARHGAANVRRVELLSLQRAEQGPVAT